MLKNPVLYPFKPACIKNLGCARPVLGDMDITVDKANSPTLKRSLGW